MPVTRELTVTYAGETFGGSTARQITGYVIHEEEYDSGYFEFEIVTTAASEDAFVSEVNAIRDAFRKPRQDLVVILGSTTILSRKHSDNTALDTFPRIIKDGDPADTGRSRHFRLRVEYGLPADNVGTGFRRWSTVNVEYSPSRQRTVTITGVYTATTTGTGSFEQYLDQIKAYVSSVTLGIDPSATWEVVGEPQVERNETNKVTTFTVVAREILHDQSEGTLNDEAIVDPVMHVYRMRIAPGDSVRGGFSFSGIGGGEWRLNYGPLGRVGSTATLEPATLTTGGAGAVSVVERPTVLRITYSCGVDKEKTKNLSALWENKIRPFLFSEARSLAKTGVVCVRENPGINAYANRIDAEMEFISYRSTVLEQKITVRDHTQFGRRLRPLTTANPYDYYEYPGPAIRQRVVVIELKQIVGSDGPEDVLNGYVNELATAVTGIADKHAGDSGWVPISNDPAIAVLKQGLVGGEKVSIAEVRIERVAQRRNRKGPSVANAGGVTGNVISLT